MEETKNEIINKNIRKDGNNIHQKFINKEITWKEYDNYLRLHRNPNKEKSMSQKYRDGEITSKEYELYLLTKEKSLYKKYKDGDITHKEYQEMLAKRRGYDSDALYQQEWKKKIKSTLSPENRLILRERKRRQDMETSVRMGFNSIAEYQKDRRHKQMQNKTLEELNDIKEKRKIKFIEFAKSRGFVSGAECQKDWRNKNKECFNKQQRDYAHRVGIHKSMSENKECSAYLGVYIAENILSKIFENVQRMPYGNPKYDFICNRGFRVEVKSSVLLKDGDGYGCFQFNVFKNTIPDYFLFIGFTSRDDLIPLHLWLIKGTEIVGYKKIKLNSKRRLSIYNTAHSLKIFEKYEQIDKLEKLIKCCEAFEK